MSAQLNFDGCYNHALAAHSLVLVGEKMSAFKETLTGKVSVDSEGRVYGSKKNVDKTTSTAKRFFLAIAHAFTSIFISSKTKENRLKGYQLKILSELSVVIDNHLLAQPPRENGNLFRNEDLNIYLPLLEFRKLLPKEQEFLPFQNKIDAFLPALNPNHRWTVR